MLITKHIEITVNKRNKKLYSVKFNKNLNLGDKINIKVSDLQKGSHTKINVKCDICEKDLNMMYKTYLKLIKNDKTNYCQKCSNIKAKKTNLKKYGVDSPIKNKEIKEKIKKTNLERHGVEFPSQLKKFEEKKKKTNLERYGVEQQTQLKKNIKKIKKTNLKRYGVDSPIKNKEIKAKIKKTNLERHGVDNPMKNFDIKKKAEQTCFKKYGFVDPMKNEEIKNKMITSHNKNFMKKYKDVVDILNINKLIKIKCDKGHVYEIDKSTFYNRYKLDTVICTKCNHINSFSKSGLEIKMINFIVENYNGKIIENSKKIIKPYELDVYLPELKLAFEFNGLYWHNEINKPKNYHKMKSDLCEEKGIQLIHIWEDDWSFKQNIVKSMILSKLGKTPIKIYGRKTEVREINDNKLIRKFLEENHIQGFVGSSIKLGLFYENDLVSLMTFGKLRKFMSTKSKDGSFEILRFCNKLNANVDGGASKLFKYFTRNYNYDVITTFVDRSYSNGNLYKEMGFEFTHKTQPNYYYVIDGVRHHRFNFRKDKLIKEGYDSNKTEHEIMLERNMFRIYNAGNCKFIKEQQ